MTAKTSPAVMMTQLAYPGPANAAVDDEINIGVNVNINIADADDDEDDRHSPFGDNSKRKSSWSAANLRRDLSPRTAAVAATPCAVATEAYDYASGAHATSVRATTANFAERHLHPEELGEETRQNVPVSLRQDPPKERLAANTSTGDTNSSPNLGVSLLQELGSALVSCGGGIASTVRKARTKQSDRPISSDTGNIKMGNDDSGNTDSMTHLAAASWLRLTDSLHKAVVQGDIDGAQRAWGDVGRNIHSHAGPAHCAYADDYCEEDDESILTYDNRYYIQSSLTQKQKEQLWRQEEEAMQLRRLTSWGTVGTFETIETNDTVEYTESVKTGHSIIEDDDGIPLEGPQKLLLKQKKLGAKNNQPALTQSRKRVVRFDYPPISSLRECPRTQPDQIKSLFFTEGELEQIEDDRYSTISADDVEIVAISTSTTMDDLSDAKAMGDDTGNENNNSKSITMSPSPSESPAKGEINDPSFRNYVSTPANKRNKEQQSKKGYGRRAYGKAFSFDDRNDVISATRSMRKSGSRRRRASSGGASGSTDASGDNNDNSSSTAASAPSDASSRRMIKSVQIYLRERSVG